MNDITWTTIFAVKRKPDLDRIYFSEICLFGMFAEKLEGFSQISVTRKMSFGELRVVVLVEKKRWQKNEFGNCACDFFGTERWPLKLLTDRR